MASLTPTPRTRIAIAGANGFVGRELVLALVRSYDVIALGRQSGKESAPDGGVVFRRCDLFNLREAEDGLEGAQIAIYLVHSMMPSAHLTQGDFEDLDLICADNFARAAAKNGVKHIVYLGGLLPTSKDDLSRHLRSRFEVEQALGSRGVPVTTLRAGLIIGAGGSSFEMMSRLVGRLPFMIGPLWTQSLSQPIALKDVVSLLLFAVERPDLAGKAYDIGGPDVLSYADMLRKAGEAQGKRTRVLTVPVRTVRLSLLWVSVITGASQALVRPLVESLSHDMIATDGLLFQREAKLAPQSLAAALAEAVETERARHLEKGKPAKAAAATGKSARDKYVCSVQRLHVPPSGSATTVAEEYVAWLPRFFPPFLRVTVDTTRTCRFYLWPLSKPLLELTFATDRSFSDRQLFYVTGGVLARLPEQTEDGLRVRPRLEFRTVLDATRALAAIHDFVPRLPWFVYKYTQALVHLIVMRAFARHLERKESP